MKLNLNISLSLEAQAIEATVLASPEVQKYLYGKTPKKVRGGQKFKKVRTGVRRPSFIDTGIFEASTKVWIE